MRTKHYLGVVVLAAAALFFNACSSTTPTTPPDYYKGIDKMGSYWIYQNQEIDTNGVLSGATYTDSMWVNGVQFIDGKQATVLVTYSAQGGTPSYDTTYIYRDANKLYAYIQPPQLPMDTVTLPKMWVLVVNQEATTKWIIVDTMKLTRDVKVSSFDVTINANMWMDAASKDSTITVASGTTYKCKESIISPMVVGAAYASKIIKVTDLNLVGGRIHQFFADGVALVAEVTEPSSFAASAAIPVPLPKNPGNFRSLLRFHIAQ